MGAVIVQRFLHGVDELGSVAVSLGVAALVLAPIAALTAPASLPSAHALSAVAVLGVVCTAVALMCYVYLISQAGASRASLITYVNPAVAVLLGVLMLGEHFGIDTVVGFGMIIIGSWLGTQGQRPKTESDEVAGQLAASDRSNM
jgi:drug/metabolite transporter (DMT)-like permease